jgi:hypothetical protein
VGSVRCPGLFDLALLATPVVGEDDQEVGHRGDEGEVDGRRQQDVQIDGLTAADVDPQDAVVGIAAGAEGYEYFQQIGAVPQDEGVRTLRLERPVASLKRGQ